MRNASRRFEPAPGDLVRFSGSSLDGSTSGTFTARVIDPHVNAADVHQVDAKGREYDRQGRIHIRILKLANERTGREFLAREFSVFRLENPRPRKYASEADRQAAYRARFAMIQTRVKPETAETLERISDETGMPRAELVNQMILFALSNRNWYTDPSFTRRLTLQAYDDRRRATKYAARPADEDDDEDDDEDEE
jgi:hypothetical protein